MAYKASASGQPPAGGVSSLLTKLLYYISWPVLTSSVGTQRCLVQCVLENGKGELLGIRPKMGYTMSRVGEFYSDQTLAQRKNLKTNKGPQENPTCPL